MDALIEAAGNSLEAFATAPLWYDIIDIGFVRDVLWYRNELRPYIEYQMKMGKV